MTAAHLPPLPPAFAPGVCADARAHRPERLSGPPRAASSLAWRAVAGGTSYCTSVGSSRRTALLRTSPGTRNNADVRSCPAWVSSTDACTLPTPPRASAQTTTGWISSPPQSGSQIGRRQREFRLIDFRQAWGEDRVYFHDETGQVVRLPVRWTNAKPPDAFAVIAAGRCRFRVDDLLRLADLIDRLRAGLRGSQPGGGSNGV